MKNKFESVFEEMAKWSDKTFGKGVHHLIIPKLYHLRKEIDELEEIINKYFVSKNAEGVTVADRGLMYLGGISEEFADCFLLLLDAARCYGMNSEMILLAIEQKLEINKQRIWGHPDKYGLVEHIKSENKQ